MPTPFNPSAPAPGLYFTPDEWSSLKDRLEDPFFDALYRQVCEGLESIEERLAKLEDGRMPHRFAKVILQHCAVIWHVEKLPRARELGIEVLETLCGQSWEPTHSMGIREADLRTGELMYMVAFAFDAFHAELDESQRRMCVEALAENGLARYFRGIEARDWWYNCDFNWNSALHGNAGIAALAIRDHDPDLSRRALDAAREGLPYMVKAAYEGGGWTEGVMYFGTALCHLVDFAYALKKVTGDDFGVPQDRDLMDTVQFALEMHGGDGLPYNFSDCSGERRGWVRPHVFWLAEQAGRPDWTADHERKMLGAGSDVFVGRMHLLFTDIDAFWYRTPRQKSEPGNLPALHHFAGIDWVTWRGTQSWLAFRGGYNGGNHNNIDLGQFIFGLGSTRFLMDPGYGQKDTDMHNCPIMRFHQQTECATAPITRCEAFEGGFRLTCDISEAFPHVLEYYRRHLLLVDDQHLIIVDDIKGRGSIRNDAQYNLQTCLLAKVTDEGFAIEGDDAALRVVLCDDTRNHEVEEWSARRTINNRLKWYDAYFRVHSVQPVVCTTSREPVSIDVGEGGVKVRIGGKEWEIVC